MLYRQQLEEVSDMLQKVDPVLMEGLARLGCEECVFAHRMLLVVMRRELSLAQVRCLN